PAITAAAITDAHRQWGLRQEARAGVRQPHANRADPDRPLRIGYVSGDFCVHPVGYFLAQVLEAHDRSTVQAICYANGTRIDDMTRRLQAAASGWREIAGLDDAQAEALIRADGIDILVDLSGHTARNRLALAGRRPAPVQASWLGYVASTGLPAIDYLITDLDTVPMGSEALFTETLVRLPHGRFCYAPPAAPTPTASAARPITFGSFNDLLKINDQVISTWAKVLQAAPGSQLRLKWSALDDAGVRERVLRAFAGHGIEAERIELSGHSPHAAMLAEYGEIDVALDPFPFCGGLTTCEAMWMGVPVVTWPGDRPASRQSLAMLKVLGLSELAASSEDDYVSIAAGLARDPARLQALKGGLRERMSASPLCRGELFTPTLEAAFRGMWRRWCAGEPPAAFDVPWPVSSLPPQGGGIEGGGPH
ncbi:MAG TPA: hypothetical protein VHX64_00220, partial [Caulobacteraceae bacterium]|nr:hypothetical protein [Caulobacteraceae bacterium]